MRCNGVAVTEARAGADRERIGLGLFPTVAMLNHTCARANVMLAFDASRVRVLTTCVVQKGARACEGRWHVKKRNRLRT